MTNFPVEGDESVIYSRGLTENSIDSQRKNELRNINAVIGAYQEEVDQNTIDPSVTELFFAYKDLLKPQLDFTKLVQRTVALRDLEDKVAQAYPIDSPENTLLWDDIQVYSRLFGSDVI